MKRILAILLLSLLLASTTIEAATKIKMNKTKLNVNVGKTATLKMVGIKKSDKVKWKTSNKKIATVSQKGKVKGIKKGKATITATVNKKKYKCVVTVKKVKKEVIKITPKDNLNKLINHINKNGFNAPIINYKMIRWEDAYGDGKGEAFRVISKNELQFTSGSDGEGATYGKGFSGDVYINFNINDLSNATINFKINAKTLEGAFATSSTIDLTKLTNKNNIQFDLDDDKNARANEVLDIALSRWNEFLQEELKLSLSDLGFENYK